MNPRWQDIESFQAESNKYYQNLYKTPLDTTRKRRMCKGNQHGFSIASLNPTDKKRLAKLIQCLAISESQRKQLQESLDEISRQKADYQKQIDLLQTEKQQLLEKQNDSNIEFTRIRQEIAAKNMQLMELEQKLQAMNDSKVESPTLSSTTLLDEKLSKIQDEIAKLTLVIPNLTNSVKQKEPQIDNFKVSMDETSGLSTTDTFKSFDSNSNLEGMLRRILKQKKVHYQDQKQNINYENDEDESSITEKSPKPISKEKREITVQVSSECQTEDPKPETVTAAIQTNELISKSVQTRELKQAKVVSEEKPIVKNTSNDQSSNSHPTCSSQYSWVCPGCANDTKNSGNRSKVHERRPSILDEPIQNINTISLIPTDESILFANDTSMVKSLIDVVSDLETENIRMNEFHRPDSTGYGESSISDDVIDAISSLNGLDI